MKKNRHRKHAFVLLVLYLVLLTYYLFFAEVLGRTPDSHTEYSYNLVLFKEIRRFIVHRELLGYKAVLLNIIGNVVAFMPFGFILPEVWDQLNKWHIITIQGFLFSLGIEIAQLTARVGSFDVDDLLLNTIGVMIGYFVFIVAKGVWYSYNGENWK
ncbi:MAG: VanZ family protein [Lachnospiraceae bacterium]|nr:VanZ family protein [Lachnospiraceae bacterium]MBQ2401653.1 VanZ family protein [Lachnospiraceae bacterium]